jgi:hypothetical protein
LQPSAEPGNSTAGFAVAFACLQVAVTALYFGLARLLPALDSVLLSVFVLMQFVGVEAILFTIASRAVPLDVVQWLTAVLKGLVLGAMAFAVIALLSSVIIHQFAGSADDPAALPAPVWLAAMLTAPCFGVYYCTRGELLASSGWEVMFAAGLAYGTVLMVESFVYEVLLQQAGWTACKPADCSLASMGVYLPLVAVFGVVESVPFAWAYRKLQSRG